MHEKMPRSSVRPLGFRASCCNLGGSARRWRRGGAGRWRSPFLTRAVVRTSRTPRSSAGGARGLTADRRGSARLHVWVVRRGSLYRLMVMPCPYQRPRAPRSARASTDPHMTRPPRSDELPTIPSERPAGRCPPWRVFGALRDYHPPPPPTTLTTPNQPHPPSPAPTPHPLWYTLGILPPPHQPR